MTDIAPPTQRPRVSYRCPVCGHGVKGWDDPAVAIECIEDDFHAPEYYHRSCWEEVIDDDDA